MSNITDAYTESLPSNVLSASHHGSRSFFKKGKDDEDVYEKHIEEIKPDYIVISAPKQEDSPHDHPHDDAMKLYKKHIEDEDNILHLGSGPYSVIVDIADDGTISVETDTELIEAYGNNEDGDDGDKKEESSTSRAYAASRTTRIDNQPMG